MGWVGSASGHSFTVPSSLPVARVAPVGREDHRGWRTVVATGDERGQARGVSRVRHAPEDHGVVQGAGGKDLPIGGEHGALRRGWSRAVPPPWCSPTDHSVVAQPTPKAVLHRALVASRCPCGEKAAAIAGEAARARGMRAIGDVPQHPDAVVRGGQPAPVGGEQDRVAVIEGGDAGGMGRIGDVPQQAPGRQGPPVRGERRPAEEGGTARRVRGIGEAPEVRRLPPVGGHAGHPHPPRRPRRSRRRCRSSSYRARRRAA